MAAPAGTPRRRRAATLLVGTTITLVGGAVAFLATRDAWQLALALAVLPLGLLCLAHPVATALIAVALLPWAVNLAHGLPLNVSATDALFAIAAVGVAFEWAVGRRLPAARSLAPVLLLTVVYAATLTAVNLVHLQTSSLIDSFQRIQLVVVPLLVGVLLVSCGKLLRGMTLYVLSACLLSAAWVADVIPATWQLQKNPVGQFLVGGILLVLVVDVGKPLRVLALPLLSVGLVTTASRGSILGLLVGLMVLLLASRGLTSLRLMAALVPLVVGLVAGYVLLPDDVQDRTTTLTAAPMGAGTSGQYTIKIREQYRADAFDLISSRPLAGVGVGNYLAGDPRQGTLTNDPHNFLLLEAAEGGVVLTSMLVVLLVGSTIIVFRRRRDTPLAPLAVAVQASLVAHGLVDIYWVRGTPVLGWLLVGAALAARVQSKERT